MSLRFKFASGSVFTAVALASLLAPVAARAQATLLLEEPYSYDGEFAGTGHAAVYLSRVCAESPTKLRRCEPGERGVVISRYHRVDGHDWLAIPLIPYLYAVENPEDIPLFADAKLVDFLRQQYLNKIGITAKEAYQLAGSAYDRTSYGFKIETTPEQDDALIRWLNAETNDNSYQLLKRNCADFTKEIINFYYPHAIHRSIVADLGVMTPKQAAKTLARSGKRHPEMQLTTFIIPQVPGLKPSKPVHGVLESLVLAKKYVTPVLMFHPFVVGGVEVAYWAGWRFEPSKNALIFDPVSGLEQPLTARQRRWYEKSLMAIKKESIESEPLADWRKFEAHTQPELGADGSPFLQVSASGETTLIGVCRTNALRMFARPELVEDLLFARIDEELKPHSPTHASERQIDRDWELLEQATKATEASVNSGVFPTNDF